MWAHNLFKENIFSVLVSFNNNRIYILEHFSKLSSRTSSTPPSPDMLPTFDTLECISFRHFIFQFTMLRSIIISTALHFSVIFINLNLTGSLSIFFPVHQVRYDMLGVSDESEDTTYSTLVVFVYGV